MILQFIKAIKITAGKWKKKWHAVWSQQNLQNPIRQRVWTHAKKIRHSGIIKWKIVVLPYSIDSTAQLLLLHWSYSSLKFKFMGHTLKLLLFPTPNLNEELSRK